MRVRPFFWSLLILSCTCVLLLAALTHEQLPAVMHIYVDQQHLNSVGFTTIKLHLTDTQGLPIEEAQVFSSASMTNMLMVTHQKSVRTLGQGNYLAQLQLFMPGPWAITIQAHTDGFAALNQTLLVQVQ